MIPAKWSRHVFPLLVLLGVMQRVWVLWNFGFQYTGSDDAIIWAGASDYAYGVFHEPYYYGQDYTPMLEALLAAPLVRLGAPHAVVLPLVSSLLTLLPFWCFGLWHQRHGRTTAAVVFAAMPLLLPNEYGMLTTLTRGFVTGVGVLALLPLCLSVRRSWLRSACVGATATAAWVVNPNALVFLAAFMPWYLMSEARKWGSLAAIAAGALPFLGAHWAGRAYAHAHPERILNTIYDWRMDFHPEGIPERLGLLDLHFQWLFPWPGLEGIGIPVALGLACVLNWRRRAWGTLIGLCGAMALIVLSFGFAKTQDGTTSVFFPYARMFLALPLLICFAFTSAERSANSAAAQLMLLIVALITVTARSFTFAGTVEEQMSAQHDVVSERSLRDLRADANAVRALCEEKKVELIVVHKHTDPPTPYPQFRAYLYAELEDGFPPTYLYGHERRYWRRERYGDLPVNDLLVLGGDTAKWSRFRTTAANITSLPGGTIGTAHLVRGNTLPIDTLMAHLDAAR